jgi:acyl-coenzyme A synthetase/AMP-(fatty) acid ligase
VTSDKNGRPDSLHAFIVLTDRPAATSEREVGAALRRELATLLPAYMLPRKFHFLPAFPLTANGKTDRKALAAMLRA